MSQVTLTRYPFAIAANGAFLLPVSGTQFFISAATGALAVRLDTGGNFSGLLSGQGYKGKPFTGLTIVDETGAPNSGFIIVSDDDYVDRRIFGAVTVSGSVAISSMPAAAWTHISGNVGPVASTIFLANAARKYLLIQNNGAGNIYVRGDSVATAAATSIKLPPGGSIEPLLLPTGAISIISDIAACAFVAVQA